MNKKTSALLPLLALGLSANDLDKMNKFVTKKVYEKPVHKSKAQRKLEKQERLKNE